MTMAGAHESSSPRFKENARAALADTELQNALKFVEVNFIARRREVADRLPEFEALRDSARDIKEHTLAYLDLYLETYEKRLVEQGGHLHYAVTGEDACRTVLDLCRRFGARTVTKGKSMVAEEIGLNGYLEANGIVPFETDLGEYIVQIRHEMPSHIIAPAVHLTKARIEEDFRRVHTHLPRDRNLTEPASLLAEARTVLRDKFLAAEVGITGANFRVAETGSSVIVTNEGNGDLTQTLPRAHIVLASIEKLVPTLEDLAQLLRVLARSATGQEMSVYTTLSTGARRQGDPDGPSEYHVVLVDNGRSAMLAGEFRDMLRCIRCGACMNHCPVYHAVGGHAYGWVYPGPMGAVLTPSLIGIDKAGHLPNASTFCGRCEEVCPVRIPLPRMMRAWREREFERHLSPATVRGGLAVWAFFARRPRLYGILTAMAARVMGLAGQRRGRFRWLPFASGWTRYRDFPATQGATFQAQWWKRGAQPRGRLDDRCDRRTARIAAVNSRSLILATIRRSLGVNGTEAPRRFEVAARLAGHPAGVVPARGQLPAAARLDLFARMVVGAAGSVERVDNPAAIPAAVAAFLRGHNLPLRLRHGDDPRLAALAWGPALEVSRGASDGSDLAAVSHAFGAVAETGNGRADLGRRQSDHA